MLLLEVKAGLGVRTTSRNEKTQEGSETVSLVLASNAVLNAHVVAEAIRSHEASIYLTV